MIFNMNYGSALNDKTSEGQHVGLALYEYEKKCLSSSSSMVYLCQKKKNATTKQLLVQIPMIILKCDTLQYKFYLSVQYFSGNLACFSSSLISLEIGFRETRNYSFVSNCNQTIQDSIEN
jgi:hypothetical protein